MRLKVLVENTSVSAERSGNCGRNPVFVILGKIA